MSDLKLIKTTENDFDLDFDGEDLVLSEDLVTAVIISLFTWARRSVDDPNPTPDGDQMGWWADETLEPTGDFVGGKVWLSTRSKITSDLFLQINQWGEECLEWMLEDGVASDISVTSMRSPANPVRVDILVRVTKPTGVTIGFNYELNWEAQSSFGGI